jgi:hypothetical protein
VQNEGDWGHAKILIYTTSTVFLGDFQPPVKSAPLVTPSIAQGKLKRPNFRIKMALLRKRPINGPCQKTFFSPDAEIAEEILYLPLLR